MELHQLECFVKTAEIGSFTKAAAFMHISQPALSKNISLLEAELGVKLFDRYGKRFSLSTTGGQVLEHAQKVLDHTLQIKLLCCEDDRPKKPVTIRMMCVSQFFSSIMAGFRPLHPDIQVQLLPNVKTTEFEESDILVFSSRQEHCYHTDCSIMYEELQLLVPKGHPLYEKTEVSLATVAKFPIISLRPDTELRSSEDYYYNLAGISPQREIECDNPIIFQTLLRSGFGVAMVPTRTWDVVSGTQNKLLPITDYHCGRYINLHLPSPESADEDTRVFFEFLTEFFRNFDTTAS